MIRRARVEDTKELMRLLSQVLQIHAEGRPDIFKGGTTKYTVEELEGIILDERTPIFVYANEDGTLSGYAFCVIETVKDSNNMHDRTTMYIDDLCVDSNCRGGGIGRKLFEHVKETAKESGFDGITLNVWELNTSARAFYEKMGLVPLKTTMEYNF